MTQTTKLRVDARRLPALGLPEPLETAVGARLAPFVEAGVLNELACLGAAAAARRSMVVDVDVILAFSLSLSAALEGHTGIRLASVEPRERPLALRWSEGRPERFAALLLPADRGHWIRAVAAAGGVVCDENSAASANALFVLRDDLLSIERMATAERQIAAAMVRLGGAEPSDLPAQLEARPWLAKFVEHLFQGDGPGLDRQVLSVVRGLSTMLTVVTGGPGMGKTWSIRVLLVGLAVARSLAQLPAPRVALVATTGKAAARMREAIQEQLSVFLGRYEESIAEADAAVRFAHVAPPSTDAVARLLAELNEFTVHRLLGWQVQTPTTFRHNASNPLPWDLVVLDEASMADVSTMASLLAAIDPRRTRLVIVGDRNQLASVESGTVLADLCGPSLASTPSTIPQSQWDLGSAWRLKGIGDVTPVPDTGPLAAAVVALQRFYRFKANSGIGLIARSVVSASPENWPVDEVLRELATERDDFVWVRDVSDDALRECAVRAAAEAYGKYIDRAGSLVCGLAGAQRLTDESAAAFSELYTTFDSYRVLAPNRVGRDGVHTLNTQIYARLLEEGRIRVVRRGRTPAWAGQPLLVTRNDYSLGLYNGDVGLVLRVHDEGREVLRAVFRVARGTSTTWRILAPERLVDAETALAMTIHKCQGSQFDEVGLLLPREVSPLLTRELVYTAITRAKCRVRLYATGPVLEGALRARVRRDASLYSRLWGQGRD